MNFIQQGINNVLAAGQGFVDGLTGQSQRKKEQARREQKAASQKRAAAQQKAATAQGNINKLLTKARSIDGRQDRAITAANKLATRSMSTAKAAVFQSGQLRNLVSGIRSDLKALANTSASSEALEEANKTIAQLTGEVKEMAEADQEYKEATDKAIAALNDSSADTTAHLDLLTKAAEEKGDWQKLATDVLPWARVALQALNLERPTNELAYYGYLAAGPFLRDRMDPATAELLTTALQIFAYWDEEGLTGLFRSRKTFDPKSQQELVNLRSDMEEWKRFMARADVAKALNDAKITTPGG